MNQVNRWELIMKNKLFITLFILSLAACGQAPEQEAATQSTQTLQGDSGTSQQTCTLDESGMVITCPEFTVTVTQKGKGDLHCQATKQ